MIPLKKDLTNTGLNLLLYQFGDKENIKALLETYLEDLDNINQDAFTLVDKFNIEDAEGIYLDYIGKLVGESRDSDTDEVFRERIKIRVLINNSEGTPDDLLDILSQLTETANVRIWEHYPVSTVLYTDGNNGTLRTLKALKDASPITSNTALIVDTTRDGWLGAELPSVYDNSKVKYRLAELLAQFDFMVDESGNFFVDENGDNIILYSGGDNGVVSYYGIPMEILGDDK